MRATFFIPVFAAAVMADSSSSVDAHPQTTFLQQTNSLGVVTGQPSVVTSQPSVPAGDSSQPTVATSVGVPNTIPAVGTGITTLLIQGTAGPNSTQTVVVSANNSTTVVLSASKTASGSGSQTTGAGASGSGASGSGSGASGTGSSGTAQSTGAAATMKAVAGSVVGVGAFMAAFL